MIKKIIVSFCILLLLKPSVKAQSGPSESMDLFYNLNAELEHLEKEIAEEETRYVATPNKALLLSLTTKKAKRELLNLYGSKAAKRSIANLSNLISFSKMHVFLKKQKELEQKYDLRINLNADPETIEEMKGLGVKLLTTVSRNESASNNRLIGVTFHYYKDLFKVGYRVTLSPPLNSELSSEPEMEEQFYDLSQITTNGALLTTEFMYYLEAHIRQLTLSLNPSNIAELEKLKNADNTLTFMSPAGKPITLPIANLKNVCFYFNDKSPNPNNVTSFRADGALQSFTFLNNTRYEACYTKGQPDYFNGYGLSLSTSTLCAPEKYADVASKICSQKDCVIIASACMVEGALNFKLKKILIESPETWPTADHTGSGEYKEVLPVNYGGPGKTSDISDYTFLNQYNADAREFLSDNNTCNSKYIPYVITIANLINTIPEVYKKCYSKKWFVENFALFDCKPCTTVHYDKYAERVKKLRERLDEIGNSVVTPVTTNVITSLITAPDLYAFVEDFTDCDYSYLTKTQKLHIVKTFAKVSINDDYERIILSLMSSVEDNEAEINDFLKALIDPVNYVNGKSLLYRLFDDFDNLGDNSYSSLMGKISSLVGNSTLEGLEFPDYSQYINYYPDSRMFVMEYGCFDQTNPSETSGCYGWLPGFTRYSQIEMLANGAMHIKSRTKGTQPQQNGNGAIYYNYSTSDYTLHPYQLISFADQSDIDEISQFSVGDGNNVIVPACFLEYAIYAKNKHEVLKKATITFDILLLAGGALEISLAMKAFRSAGAINKIISAAQAGWGAALIAGGAMDLSVQMSSSVDPEFKGFVEKYNMAIAILSIPSALAGLTRLASGAYVYAGKTYNTVAQIMVAERPLLTATKLLKNELLARLVVYNMKLNQANALKTLQNQALLAESNYLTNNYIKVFHRAAYDEAVLTASDFYLSGGYLAKHAECFYKSCDEFCLTFDKNKLLSTEIRTEAYDLYRQKDWTGLGKFFKDNMINEINGAYYPPANGGYNLSICTLKKGMKFDRYQETFNPNILVDGEPLLVGSYLSPIINQKSYSYGERALRAAETQNALFYEIEILEDLPFNGETGDVIPWFNFVGNGKQTKFNLYNDGNFPVSLTKLALTGKIKITIKSSPNNQFSSLIGRIIAKQ